MSPAPEVQLLPWVQETEQEREESESRWINYADMPIREAKSKGTHSGSYLAHPHRILSRREEPAWNSCCCFFFTLFWMHSRKVFCQWGQRHGGHCSFELQINQGLLFCSFPFSPRSQRLHKVKVCVCVCADLKVGMEGGVLSPAGLAYNSDRAGELKAAQRHDGRAKWSLPCALFE